MSLVKIVKVALALSTKSVPEKIEFVRIVIKSMTGNTNFGAGIPIYPPLADITIAVDELEQAAIKANYGGVESTAVMYEKEFALNLQMTALGHYVENVANQNHETAESVVLSAGMEVKGPGEPQPALQQPENLRGAYGRKRGEILLRCRPVKGALIYIWLISETPNDPDSFVMMNNFANGTSKSKFTWSGLEPGKLYAFKVFVYGVPGRSPFSDVMVHRAA
jgi:hypothetical protein